MLKWLAVLGRFFGELGMFNEPKESGTIEKKVKKRLKKAMRRHLCVWWFGNDWIGCLHRMSISNERDPLFVFNFYVIFPTDKLAHTMSLCPLHVDFYLTQTHCISLPTRAPRKLPHPLRGLWVKTHAP